MTTRETLIETVREQLLDRGYNGMSPRSIQDQAGVGQGSMYHHFSGKAALTLAALRRNDEQLRRAASDCLDRTSGLAEGILAYLHLERKALKGCRMGSLVYDSGVMQDEQLRRVAGDYFAWITDRLTTALAKGQAVGELGPTLVPRSMALLIVSSLQGAFILARAAQSSEPFDAIIENLSHMINKLKGGLE